MTSMHTSQARMNHRKVLLVDLDAFFASVEVLLDPSLKGKPLAVGGNPHGRGVVAAASYEARVYGVHSAMPMRHAVDLCPDLLIRPPNRDAYAHYSRQVMALLREYTLAVEPVSIDEAYLELPLELPFYRAGEVGQEVQRRIGEEFGLPCSVGVATSKLVAKMACESCKPQGFLVIPPGDEARFLAPMPVSKLPGVGPRTEAALREHGLETIGQLAQAPAEFLARLFGKRGLEMRRHATGHDDSPVVSEREARSRSVEETFPRDLRTLPALLDKLRPMSEEVAQQLRKERLLARTVGIKLRYADFTTLTRSYTRPHSTNDPQAIYRDAAALLERTWERGRPVRLLGVRAERFVSQDDDVQGTRRLL